MYFYNVLIFYVQFNNYFYIPLIHISIYIKNKWEIFSLFNHIRKLTRGNNIHMQISLYPITPKMSNYSNCQRSDRFVHINIPYWVKSYLTRIITESFIRDPTMTRCSLHEESLVDFYLRLVTDYSDVYRVDEMDHWYYVYHKRECKLAYYSMIAFTLQQINYLDTNLCTHTHIIQNILI